MVLTVSKLHQRFINSGASIFRDNIRERMNRNCHSGSVGGPCNDMNGNRRAGAVRTVHRSGLYNDIVGATARQPSAERPNCGYVGH